MYSTAPVGITLTIRPSERLKRTIDIMHNFFFYLSTQSQLCIIYLLHKKLTLSFKKIKLYITEATCANRVFFTALIVTGVRAYHKLIQNSS